jgi:hypothetical protein
MNSSSRYGVAENISLRAGAPAKLGLDNCEPAGDGDRARVAGRRDVAICLCGGVPPLGDTNQTFESLYIFKKLLVCIFLQL